jgi:hypothetical protein
VSDYGIALFPQHQKLLRASAISPEVARQRNYQSVDTKTRLESIDIPKAHRLVPGLLLPVYGPESTNGEAATWQYRPDHPRIDAKGKPAKYVTAMRGLVVDVPPAVRPRIGDPDRPLWITEGIRKVDSAVTAGIDCLGVLGVWNFRGGNTNLMAAQPHSPRGSTSHSTAATSACASTPTSWSSRQCARRWTGSAGSSNTARLSCGWSFFPTPATARSDWTTI